MTDRREQMPDIEFITLVDGKPTVFAAGSFDDYKTVAAQAAEIDADMDPEVQKGLSPGARHLYKTLGAKAGIDPAVTEDVLNGYDATRAAATKAYRDRLREELA